MGRFCRSSGGESTIHLLAFPYLEQCSPRMRFVDDNTVIAGRRNIDSFSTLKTQHARIANCKYEVIKLTSMSPISIPNKSKDSTSIATHNLIRPCWIGFPVASFGDSFEKTWKGDPHFSYFKNRTAQNTISLAKGM